MHYYSLRKQSPETDFRTATLLGQAPDGGLYFPAAVPKWEAAFLAEIPDLSAEELGFRIMSPYVGASLPERVLRQILIETLSFDIPLVTVTDRIQSLELFHGPTLAFKDVGARFMSRCLGYFAQEQAEKRVVLVATSGDTGGAVANGFYDVEGIEVVILYPSGKVSPVQEKQLTTLGKNIHALEVDGNFDDCQRMVKTAFLDAEMKKSLNLTSANSINVARWLPQQLYYVLAWQQWEDKNRPPVISVPSGNFGNICAGLLAFCSGLPADHFIAACNSNDTIPRFLQQASYDPHPARATLSNAMDVADPSNFIRILELFNHSLPKLKQVFTATTSTDEETFSTLARIFKETGYRLDPHGAIGFLALENWLKKHPDKKGYFLETAHPVKFPDSVELATGQSIMIPEQVLPLMQGEKKSIPLTAKFDDLRSYLIALKA